MNVLSTILTVSFGFSTLVGGLALLGIPPLYTIRAVAYASPILFAVYFLVRFAA